MNRRIMIAAMACLVALLATSLSPRAQSIGQSTAEVELRAAMELEKAKGQTAAAIEAYKKLAQSSDASVAEKARQALARLQGASAVPGLDTTGRLPEGILAGFNTRPDFSPDGKQVAGGQLIGSETQMQGAIIVRDIANRADRVLATGLNGFVQRVRFSPDGARVAAYVGSLPGSRIGGSESDTASFSVRLVVAAVRAGTVSPTAIPVWSGRRSELDQAWYELAWSPDAEWLPYVSNIDGKFEAFLLNVPSGKVTPLGVSVSVAPDFVWAPDGRELALHVVDAAAATDVIRIVTVATRQARNVPLLRKANLQTRLGGWTTRGEVVVTQSETGSAPATTQVSLVRLTDGASTKTCSGYPLLSGIDSGIGIFGGTVDLCLGFTRDGASELVWKHDAKRLAVIDTATTHERLLTTDFGEERGGSLSPDGRRVVFVSNREARWGLYSVSITNSERQLPVLVSTLDDLPRLMDIQWVGAGVITRVVFEDSHVLRVAIDPTTGKSVGDLHQLTQDSAFNVTPTLSADGSQIAYYARSGGLVRPAVMEADGSNERVLNAPPSLNFRNPLAWLGPQELLQFAVATNVSPLAFQFFRVNTATGDRKPLPGPSLKTGTERGSWAFDRQRQEIIFPTNGAAAGPHEFHAWSLATGSDRVVASLANPSAPLDHFVLSPDGSRLVYLLSTNFTSLNHCAPCELGVIDLPSGTTRRLPAPTAPQGPVAVSPNNRFLLYGAARPRIMNLETGESWPLMEPAKQPAWDAGGGWAADGSFVVLSVGSQRIEWRRWTNVGGGR